MTTTDGAAFANGANPTQNAALGFVIAFLVSLFLILALPVYSGAESALSQAGGEEIGPFVVLVAVILGFALAGRRSPLASGVASGIIALISLALGLTTTIVLLIASLFNDFGGYDFGGGMWAIVAASVLGFVAVILSAQNWRGLSPPTWTPVAIIGSIASVAMIVGLAIPEEGYTLSQTLGFEAHAVVGIAFTTFLVLLALVGVAGFAFGRWGVGLLGGFIGYILVGWFTSGGGGQSSASGWSGVTSGFVFQPLTVIGFWTAAGMFVIHAVQQLSGRVPATEGASAKPSSLRPSSVPATWAPDPYGRGVHRYWNGRTWTKNVSDASGNVLEAPTELVLPVGAAPDWYPDPLQRYEHRYFDGTGWTARVATGGVASTDRPRARPPVVEAAPPSAPAPPSPAPPAAAQPIPGASIAPPVMDDAIPSGPPLIVEVASCVIVFGDGHRRDVTDTMIIGRSPSPIAEFVGAELQSVNDITVSKTHAAVGCTASTVWVRDLDSSNGVTIDDGTGERRIEPGQSVSLDPGVRVVIGDDTSFVVEKVNPDSTIRRPGLGGHS